MKREQFPQEPSSVDPWESDAKLIKYLESEEGLGVKFTEKGGTGQMDGYVWNEFMDLIVSLPPDVREVMFDNAGINNDERIRYDRIVSERGGKLYGVR